MRNLLLTLTLAAAFLVLPGMAGAEETTPCDPDPDVWVSWCPPPTFGPSVVHACREFHFYCMYLG